MGLTLFGREFGLNPVRNLGNAASMAASGAGTVARNAAAVAPGGSPVSVVGGFLGQERGLSEAIQTTPGASTGGSGLSGLTGNMTTEKGATLNPGGTFGDVSGGSGGASAATINSIYDSRNARLNNLLGGIDAQRQSALDIFNQNAAVQENALNNAISSGRANLDFQDQQNQQAKARSYRDIAQGIRNTLESSANRLGTMNASDSSAANMLQYALANLQAQQRGQANDVFGTNQAQIGMARTNMENEFNNQLMAFNQEKRNRIQEISDRFQQTRAQILDEMAQSDESRRLALADLGQQVTSAALADISALENQYNTAAQQWLQQALSAVPQVNTQPFSATAQTSDYGTYGRGSLPMDNITDQQVTDAYDQAGLPIRKFKDQYAF